ncbi:MAG: RadC family protein [Lachnospiraceae bacterium]
MKNKIKDMPKDQRPYEKCESFGPECLADAELLAVIIRTGCEGKQSVELAADIIRKGGVDGILGICRLDIRELMDIKGIGRVKAIQIKCIGELAKRISKSTVCKKLIFNNPKIIADYFMEECRHKEKEELKVIMLNSKSLYLGDVNVSVGTVNASYASAREVFIEAFRYKAVAIVLLHNHPSGDCMPSRQDIEVTKKIKEAGEIIGIKLIDHIIIGDNKYISLTEKGLIL